MNINNAVKITEHEASKKGVQENIYKHADIKKGINIKTSFYVNENNSLLLYEVRGFTDNDEMIGAYLQIFTQDIEVLDEEIDDVWEYANWLKI